jgi:DNA-binding transcriptional LysR family regulator
VVDLDTRLLRAFVAVAEDLNFTRAAERLHLAQQALSSQIRQLETRLGLTLFERTTRRVEPTAAATALLPHARAALEAVEQVLRKLPLGYRQVIVLHYVAGLPLDEVAAELELPLGTVKSRLARARMSMATQLSP